LGQAGAVVEVTSNRSTDRAVLRGSLAVIAAAVLAATALIAAPADGAAPTRTAIGECSAAIAISTIGPKWVAERLYYKPAGATRATVLSTNWRLDHASFGFPPHWRGATCKLVVVNAVQRPI
jgi:hypothetical protein